MRGMEEQRRWRRCWGSVKCRGWPTRNGGTGSGGRVLKRLSRNKRSGEGAGEWRGLMGDEVEMERKEFGGT